MMWAVMYGVVLKTLTMMAAAAAPTLAVEIATGKMLGAGYDQRAFYTRENGSAQWQKTYTGARFRPEAAGRLMNLRVAQALFHDEWLTEEPFDPDKHTGRVIAALDTWKAHGVLAVSISLQGGNMAYERTSNIKRGRDHNPGPGKGSLVSAFRPDGSLKPAWMGRALRLVRELDRRGMILNLMYFYGHQDEGFANTAAIDRAVVAVTDWLIDNSLRNVIIEIANEYDIKAWDHDRYVFREMGKLIELARGRFAAKKAAFRLPITASATGMRVFEELNKHADLTAVHGNNRSPEEKRKRIAELYADPSVPGPIYMNEDDNGRETTTENLKKELASCTAVFESGGSWGYMPWVQLQIYPFRHVMPGKTARVANDMPVEQRDPAYFKAVLEHIRGFLYKDASRDTNN
jgi:hypothetical protein